jgi:hypothetical protein
MDDSHIAPLLGVCCATDRGIILWLRGAAGKS